MGWSGIRQGGMDLAMHLAELEARWAWVGEGWGGEVGEGARERLNHLRLELSSK